jgi:hypothetical protein
MFFEIFDKVENNLIYVEVAQVLQYCTTMVENQKNPKVA